MALPSNVGTGTVKGYFADSNGVTMLGAVTFTPSFDKGLDPTATPDPTWIVPAPVTATLSAGKFTTTLVATDDTDINPTGWTYAVSFAFTNGPSPATFSIAMPQGATVDLTTVAPVPAANGTYYLVAGNNPPAGITARANPYDRVRSIYNLKPSNTRRSRARIDSARVGSLCKIAHVGHSLVAGAGAKTGETDASSILRKMFDAAGFPSAGTGYIANNNSVNLTGAAYNLPFDSRLVMDAGYTSSYSFTSFAASGKKWTYTADRAGDQVVISYANNSGPFTYNIAGAGAVTVTPSGSSTRIDLVVTAAVAAGQTVVLTTTSASAVYMFGVRIRKTAGIEVTNFGQSGSLASDWLPSTNGGVYYNHYNMLVSPIAPDVVVLNLDANEVFQGVPVATYSANMTTIITGLVALGIDVKLVRTLDVVPQTGATRSVWDTYGNAIYDLADTFDIPLLDLTDRFGVSPYAAGANPLGIMFSDGVHLLPAGYSDYAHGVYALLGAA